MIYKQKKKKDLIHKTAGAGKFFCRKKSFVGKFLNSALAVALDKLRQVINISLAVGYSRIRSQKEIYKWLPVAWNIISAGMDG